MVLAAGRGTRMRAPEPGAQLDPAQRRLAERGLKPLIPFHGHPYLSYGLTDLADAGFRHVCLVVGPEPDPIRAHYAELRTRRLRIAFAVQPEPRGGADALLRARPFAGDEPIAVLNADNHYPAPALAALRALEGPGLVAFRRDALVARSNIPEERIAAFALVSLDERGRLRRIVEKPTPE
ncbi:MAG TPA: sugar phosphate nucleotidyltransferase, partial [Longimicrobiales bacterium]|nr:sugar phosphate nucleotidyltransferase [Longimicrobiales bacterium]